MMYVFVLAVMMYVFVLAIMIYVFVLAVQMYVFFPVLMCVLLTFLMCVLLRVLMYIFCQSTEKLEMYPRQPLICCVPKLSFVPHAEDLAVCFLQVS